MYLQQFSLTRYPFNTDLHCDELLSTAAVTETEHRIKHLLELRGIGLITGEAGCGKTTACRQAVEKLHRGQYRVCYASLTTGSVVDTLNVIAKSMGLPAQRVRGTAWHVIREEIKRLCDERKLQPLVVVDEAHHLRNDVIEDLRLICNFNFDSQNRITLLLVGLTELRNRLRMSVHESFAQRLIMNYQFGTLSFEETCQYIAHHMKVAGAAEVPHFEDAALRALHAAAVGVPRQLNRIVHYTLIAAASEQAKQANAQHVENACREVGL